MNEPSSTMQRLIYKLNLLDSIDEQSGSGKLDLIVQLPYTVKSELKRNQANQRKKDLEMQLSGSKYGIAYIDAAEKVTQLLSLIHILYISTYMTIRVAKTANKIFGPVTGIEQRKQLSHR